ncbi:hypothetical protein B4114_3007 [Geobacillus stearothermophilus]|uniref:Uncharacterized protein n=1 Tax=Geobacillus stearothermophilus TaxID=1422 RepID=A0A150NEK7_GEOSE|nr:hypothetical protein B4114_3007 [Geobacillus stearothermophilus]
MFQSLIGTIKTYPNPNERCSGSKVSIPHRYDKNSCPSNPVAACKLVSIPHRYDKNPKNACSIKLFGLELFSAYHVSKILSTAFNLDGCRLEALKTIVVDPPGF